MNANLKLLPAALLVSVLTLAGCGGGGSSDDVMDTADARPEMTDAEKCNATNKIYTDDGACLSEEEIEAHGAKDESDKRDMTESDMAKMALAKTLHGVLSDATNSMINPTGFAASYSAADDDMKDKMAASVMGQKFSEVYIPGTTSGVSTDGKNSLSATIVAIATTGNANVKADVFSKSGPKTHKKELVRGSTIYFSTPGSYNGVAGVYECAGNPTDACTSARGPNGENVILTGTWTFTPTNPDDRVVADGVEYGWWTNETSGSISMAHVFYAPKGLTARSELPTSHGGKATYNGRALGQYSIYRGETGMNDAGEFTADAELTATFGTSPSIAGTIKNFKDADEMTRKWEVALKKLSDQEGGVYGLDSDATDGSPGDNMVVWTIGDDKSADGGHWQVTTYGGGSGDPAAVAGGFQAEHGVMNARMIGAFGAEKQDE